MKADLGVRFFFFAALAGKRKKRNCLARYDRMNDWSKKNAFALDRLVWPGQRPSPCLGPFALSSEAYRRERIEGCAAFDTPDGLLRTNGVLGLLIPSLGAG